MIAPGPVEDDLVAALVRLLDRALRRLGDEGCRDEACQIAAEAWALLEPGREREARRLNGILHYLTRPATGEG
jgi:hypothetical protein